MNPREILSEALQGQAFHFVWVDVVADAGLLRGRDVAPVVDRWKVRHPNAQQILRHHDFGEVAVADGQRHIQVHRQIESGPVAVDLVVEAERLAGVCRLHHLRDPARVLGQGADVEPARPAQIAVKSGESREVLLSDRQWRSELARQERKPVEILIRDWILKP